jgi:hypothetical protein
LLSQRVTRTGDEKHGAPEQRLRQAAAHPELTFLV